MLFLPTLLKGIGSGISIAAQFGGSRQRRKISRINYQIDRNNATIKRDNTLAGIEIDRIRNRGALDAATFNYDLAVTDNDARLRNAERMRQFAEARTGQSRDAIRRQIRAFDQFESRQEAIIGASGVAFEGSALDVLAETAGQMQLAIQDMANDAQFDRDETLNKATVEEFGANQSLLSSRVEFDSASSAFRTNEAASKLGAIGASQEFNASMFGALGQRESQYDLARGQRRGAVASIFTGAAGFATDNNNRRYNGIQ